jgi:hypothetical protein
MRKPLCTPPALALFLLLPVGGCESGAESLAPVQGKVSYRGVTLHTGTIVFSPDPARGTFGPVASGQVQADGSYSLWTGAQPGAVIGWHRITIIAMESDSSGPAKGRFTRPHSLLPEHYRDPATSGLYCEIKGGQENQVDIDLD